MQDIMSLSIVHRAVVLYTSQMVSKVLLTTYVVRPVARIVKTRRQQVERPLPFPQVLSPPLRSLPLPSRSLASLPLTLEVAPFKTS